MIVLHFDRPVMTGVIIIGEGVRQRARPTVGGRMRMIHLGRLRKGRTGGRTGSGGGVGHLVVEGGGMQIK